MCIDNKRDVDIKEGIGYKMVSICNLNGETKVCDYNNIANKIPYLANKDGWIQFCLGIDGNENNEKGFYIFAEEPSEDILGWPGYRSNERINLIAKVEYKNAFKGGFVNGIPALIVQEFRPLNFKMKQDEEE